MSRRRYTPEEVVALRLRFEELTAELNEVLDQIVARVTAFNEEMDLDDSTGAPAAASAERLDHRRIDS